jgi:hypothetical protein
VLAQQNGNVSNKRYEANDTSNDVFFTVKEELAASVEFRVVCKVVVTLCEEAERRFTRS